MKILTAPHPVLFKKAKPVRQINKRIVKLVNEMAKTLLAANNPKGIGLAAPQVGKPLRLFIVKLDQKSPLHVFVNPQITYRSKKMATGKDMFEGCLSIPKIWGSVKRHQKVTLSYQTTDGKQHKKTFSGLMATIIQHEMDHLDGTLFTKRTIEQSGKLYQLSKEKDEKGKPVFQEVKL